MVLHVNDPRKFLLTAPTSVFVFGENSGNQILQQLRHENNFLFLTVSSSFRVFIATKNDCLYLEIRYLDVAGRKFFPGRLNIPDSGEATRGMGVQTPHFSLRRILAILLNLMESYLGGRVKKQLSSQELMNKSRDI